MTMWLEILAILWWLHLRTLKATIVIDKHEQQGLNLSDFCPKMPYCAEGSHVMCLHYDPKRTVGASCHGFQNITMTPVIAERLLLIINEARGLVASGNETGKDGKPLPRAYGMFKLKWDSELATFAQVWANQCVFKTDLCRASLKFPNPTQVNSLVRFSLKDWQPLGGRTPFPGRGLTLEKILYGISRAFSAWYIKKEYVTPQMLLKTPDWYKDADGKQFIELLDGSSTHMGCGLSAYAEYQYPPRTNDSILNVIRLVCNLSSSPKRGTPVYNTVPPVQKPGEPPVSKCGCPEGIEEDDRCLCTEEITPPFTEPTCGKDKNCPPAVVLLPIFTVENTPDSKRTGVRKDWGPNEILDSYFSGRKSKILHNLSYEDEVHDMESDGEAYPNSRAPYSRSKYFGGQKTLLANHGKSGKKSVFARAPKFELSKTKSKFKKKEVVTRKDFSNSEQLLKSYINDKHQIQDQEKGSFRRSSPKKPIKTTIKQKPPVKKPAFTPKKYSAVIIRPKSYPVSKAKPSKPVPKKPPVPKTLPKKYPVSKTQPKKYPAAIIQPKKYPAAKVPPKKKSPVAKTPPKKYPVGKTQPKKYPAAIIQPKKYPVAKTQPKKYPATIIQPKKYTDDKNKSKRPPQNNPKVEVKPKKYPLVKTNIKQKSKAPTLTPKPKIMGNQRDKHDAKDHVDLKSLNDDADVKLMSLLDTLEREVKHIELDGNEKEIFDAKIRKIYGTVVGKHPDLLKPKFSDSADFKKHDIVFRYETDFDDNLLSDNGEDLDKKSVDKQMYDAEDRVNALHDNANPHMSSFYARPRDQNSISPFEDKNHFDIRNTFDGDDYKTRIAANKYLSDDNSFRDKDHFINHDDQKHSLYTNDKAINHNEIKPRFQQRSEALNGHEAVKPRFQQKTSEVSKYSRPFKIVKKPRYRAIDDKRRYVNRIDQMRGRYDTERGRGHYTDYEFDDDRKGYYEDVAKVKKYGDYDYEAKDEGEDVLGTERRKYYQEQLDNLERKLHSSRLTRRRGDHELEHTRRMMRARERMPIRPSRPKTSHIYIPDRARFLHGFR